MLSRAFCASVVVVTLSLLSFGQHTSLENGITVNVRNFNNQPVADARVEIRDSNGQAVASGYTNASGVVELRRVPAGNLEIVAISGVSEVRERAEMNMAGASVTLRLAANAEGSQAGGKHSVSISQLKVPGKARDQYEKARKRMLEGKSDEAMSYVNKALEIHPKYAEAYTVRCVLELDKQQKEAAVSDCEKAVELDPGYALGYFALGAAYNQTSHYDDALRVLDRGNALSPMDWQGYFELSKAQIGKGNYQAALKAVQKAQTYSKVEYAPVYLVKGHILLALKNYGEAMAELQLYLDKAPKNDDRSAEVRATLDKVKAFTAANGQ